MRIIFAAIAGAVAIAIGVFGGLYLWNQHQSEERVELVKYCMLRAEYWSRVTPELRRMEPECVAIGIDP